MQEEVEKALKKIFHKSFKVTGSGRTDTGVHALRQEAHFEVEEEALKKIKSLKEALSFHLPPDIVPLQCFKAPENFHARFDVIKKTYQYLIWQGESPSVFFKDLCVWRKKTLDLKKLQSHVSTFCG